MKKPHLSSLIIAVCLLLGLSSCKNQTSKTTEPADTPEMVTKALVVDAIGTYKYVGPDTLAVPRCTDSLNVWRALVHCTGTSNVLGEIEVFFDFCGDQKGYYGNLDAYILDKDGDTLFVGSNGIGQVIDGRLDDHAEFVTSYWKDEFVITGGTGKYEGASGKCTTDDYNSSEDPNSHHHWEGEITLKK